MKLYHYPNCSTCRKAIKFLGDQGLEVDAVDISQTPPSKAELRTMLSAYQGNVRKLFNTSGMLYRELNMKDRLPGMSEAEAIDLLSDHGMLIKRPFLLVSQDQGVVGFKAQEWEALL